VRLSPSPPPIVSRLFAAAGLCLLAGTAAPRHELRLGIDYWSQDSLAQVFAGAGSNTKLHIAWPDGRAAVVAILDGAKSIKISKPDEVQIVH